MTTHVMVMTAMLLGVVAVFAVQVGAEDDAKPRVPQLSDLAFMEGSWVAEGGGTTTREHWLPASKDAMAAVTHMTRGGKTSLYELSAIEQRADGMFLVIRHFSAKLEPWASEKDGPGSWQLDSVKRGENGTITARFRRENRFPQFIVYAKTGATTMEARLEGTGNDGQPHTMVFSFKRP